jgi:hypothetical protein
LNLTFSGDYSENVQADEEVWKTYERGQVYWVEQTSLLLLTMRNSGQSPGRAADEVGGVHGSATSGAVEKACGDCYVMAVQDNRSLDGLPVRELARNVSYADIVTSSNFPGVPDRVPFEGDQAYANATYELWETGRPFIPPSGNQVVSSFGPQYQPGNPFPYADVQLPPWVIPAGGVHSACDGSEPRGGKPPEVVGDFVQRLPAPGTMTQEVRISGTSFAAPQVAGEFGQVLTGLRQALGPGDSGEDSVYSGSSVNGSILEDGRLTIPEFRKVVHHSATYFEAEEFEVGCGGRPTPGPAPDVGATPVSASPYVQMGWGYVGDNATDTALDVILGETPLPEKSEDAKRFMEAFRETRETLYPWPNESES